jgi:hypothetical protein
MHPLPPTDHNRHKPIRIFLLVSAAILVSETIAIVLISGVRNPVEELLEVLLLTTLLSTTVYLLLIRPMTAEIALRHSAETSLRNERNRLEQVTSAIDAGLTVIDRDFKVLWSNRLLMQNFKSIPGTYCYNAFKHSYDGPCADCGVRELLEKGLDKIVSEHRLIDATGREGWFQVIVTPIRDTGGSIIAALELILPIGDRKAVENALVYSQNRFQYLVESSVDWVWEIDANGRYTYVGPQCLDLLGYEPEEIYGMTPFELMPADERERLLRKFQGIAEKRESFMKLENCLVRKDGTVAVMETSGSPFFDSNGTYRGYRGIDRDISERKALETLRLNYQRQLEQQVREQTIKLQQLLAEQKKNFSELQSIETSLRQSEFRFRQVFEHSRDAIILFGWESGAVCDANPAAQDLFEGTRNTLLGMYWHDFNMRNEASAPLKLNEIGRQGELLLMRGGVTTLAGKTLVVSLWGKVLNLEGRQVAFCSLRDITEKIRLEKESQEIHTKLIQANKMTSLGFLVAGIAHEINNPNNNILLSAQMLGNIWKDCLPILSRCYDDEGDFILGGDYFSEVRESIPKLFNMITDGSRRIEITINNLRDFTIKSKTEMTQLVDINKLVSISASILQHQIKKHTRNFTFILSPELFPVKGNLQQLEQVLVNLIVNAIQALTTKDQAVRVSTVNDALNTSVAITVSDEGCGILPEHMSHVLDPFFSTKLETGGTGLGLAISNNIIKEHGGRMEIQSAVGIGTSVTIRLPASISCRKEHQQ